jgi:hypothetical protein
MLLITITLVVLFYWRLFVVKDLSLLVTVFWVVFPDLGSFIPIGLAVRGGKEWPRWGTRTLQFLPYISRLDSGVCHLEHIIWSHTMAASRLGRSHYS